MSRPYDWDEPDMTIEIMPGGLPPGDPAYKNPDHARVLRLPPERVHSPYRWHFNENARALIELQHLVAELHARVEELEGAVSAKQTKET